MIEMNGKSQGNLCYPHDLISINKDFQLYQRMLKELCFQEVISLVSKEEQSYFYPFIFVRIKFTTIHGKYDLFKMT